MTSGLEWQALRVFRRMGACLGLSNTYVAAWDPGAWRRLLHSVIYLVLSASNCHSDSGEERGEGGAGSRREKLESENPIFHTITKQCGCVFP